MSIKSVTSANLAEYVAERAKPAEMQTAAQITEAVNKMADAKNAADPVVIEAKETKPNVSGAPDPGEQEPTAKKKNPVQPRIDELTAQKRELEEFAESEYEMRLRAERRIGELESELKSAKPAETAAKEAVVDSEPKAATYTDQEKFLADWGAWNRRQAVKDMQAAEQERLNQVARVEQDKRIQAQIEQAKQDLPDFVEVIESAERENPFVPEYIKDAILDSDVGAQLAYHIRKFPEDEKRIYALSPVKALKELGKLELKYLRGTTASAEVSSKTSTTDDKSNLTKAPPPPPRLKGQEGGVVITNTSAPMNFKDYRNARLEQQRSNKRR